MEIGQRLGNYRLTRLLGEGGFSEVYLGEHVFLGTLAAVKVQNTVLDQKSLNEFLSEARTIARLKHSNIVRVFDFGENDGRPFLVMDYAPYGTLRHLHQRGSLVPLATVVSYVNQIASALSYAHERKLIHRDVKPANMLLGVDNTILLSDFGIAVTVHATDSRSMQDVAGTVTYMSPEQLQGLPQFASDQYALAVVVYEWLCGHPPFMGDFMEVANSHLYGVPIPLRQHVREISPAVEMVVLTSLSKEPQQRFASVMAFANALERAYQLEQEPAKISTFLTGELGRNIMPLSANTVFPQEEKPSAHDGIDDLPTINVVFPHYEHADSITEIARIPSPSEKPIENICPFCADRIRPGDNFCLNCGNRLPAVAPSRGEATMAAPDNWGLSDEGGATVAAEDDWVKRYPQEVKEKEQGLSLLGSLLRPLPTISNPLLKATDMISRPQSSLSAENGAALFAVQAPSSFSIELPAVRDQTKARLLGQADAYHKARQYKDALVTYESVIQLDAKSVPAYIGKGNVLLECEQYTEALFAYSTAIHFSASDANLWMYKGYALIKMERYDDALDAYNRAIEIDVRLASAHLYKGHILLLIKKYKEALVAYEKVLALEPDDVIALVARGNALYKLRQYKKALTSYERAIMLAPDDATIWVTKGNVFSRLKRYNEAVAAYDQALILTPNDSQIWFARGEALMKQKSYVAALEAYNRVISLMPDNAGALAIRGNIFCELARSEEALKDFNHALQLHPRNASIWLSKGTLLSQLGRYDEALEACERAHFYKPNNISIAHQCEMLRQLKLHKEENEHINAQETFIYDRSDVVNQSTLRYDFVQDTHVPRDTQNHSEVDQNLKTDLGGYDVFLSYSHENPADIEWVSQLAGRLMDEAGLNVWLDRWILVAGRSWQQEIARGLEQARCCAVCIGNLTSSGWFDQEIQSAKNRQAKNASFGVIPVLLPSAKSVNIDSFLELNTLVNFRDHDLDYAFHVLICGIKGIPPGRWPSQEATATLGGTKIEGKLRELQIFRRENLIDDSVAVEFQRTVLEKYWLE